MWEQQANKQANKAQLHSLTFFSFQLLLLKGEKVRWAKLLKTRMGSASASLLGSTAKSLWADTRLRAKVGTTVVVRWQTMLLADPCRVSRGWVEPLNAAHQGVNFNATNDVKVRTSEFFTLTR